MTVWPNIVALVSLIGCVFFCLRAHHLKKERAGPVMAASGSVRFWIFVQAAVAGFHAQAVFFTQTATWTEMILALSASAYALAMWWNVRSRVPKSFSAGLKLQS